MKKIKVLLFFGYHEYVDDANDAIKAIQKTTKHIKNKDMIIIIEKSGWADGFNKQYYTENFNDQQYKDQLQIIDNEYKKWINKIENNISLEDSEINWPTSLYKFGYENGYKTLFEQVNPKIIRKILKSPQINNDKFISLQIERDKLLIKKQILPLIEKYPEKTILIVRGIGHEKILPPLLKKSNINYEITKYSEKTRIERDKEIKILSKKIWDDFKMKGKK